MARREAISSNESGVSQELAAFLAITSSFAAIAGFMMLLTVFSVSGMVGKDDLLWSVD